MIAEFPEYLSKNTAWSIGCPDNSLMVTAEPYKYLGYQGYPGINLIKDPATLGGLWFGSRRRSHKKRKSLSRKRKSLSRKKISRRSRRSNKTHRGLRKMSRFGSERMVTPGGITTSGNWGFKML